MRSLQECSGHSLIDNENRSSHRVLDAEPMITLYKNIDFFVTIILSGAAGLSWWVTGKTMLNANNQMQLAI